MLTKCQTVEVDNTKKLAFTRHDPIGVCGQMYSSKAHSLVSSDRLFRLIAFHGTTQLTCGKLTSEWDSGV